MKMGYVFFISLTFGVLFASAGVHALVGDVFGGAFLSAAWSLIMYDAGILLAGEVYGIDELRRKARYYDEWRRLRGEPNDKEGYSRD